MTDARYDVVGIGNAIVDLIGTVEPGFLAEHGMVPGSMALVDAARARELAAAVGTLATASGGSVANSCAVAAMLGSRTAFLGKVADDGWGEAFRREIGQAGVHFPTPPLAGAAPTACCLVLVTPDAQRTMSTHLGACVDFGRADLDEQLIAQSAILYLEGYLFDPPAAQAAFRHAAGVAREAGRMVALSLSDPFCVERHREGFLSMLAQTDILFANEAEIGSLYQAGFGEACAQAAATVKLVVATRGAAGSVILCGGQIIEVAPVPIRAVDTTGAGDCYAAGFLSALALGRALAACGAAGSAAASACIASYGARPAAATLRGLL